MQLDEFTMAVRQMRHYQKQAADNSRVADLKQKAEHKVDQMLASLFEPQLNFD